MAIKGEGGGKGSQTRKGRKDQPVEVTGQSAEVANMKCRLFSPLVGHFANGQGPKGGRRRGAGLLESLLMVLPLICQHPVIAGPQLLSVPSSPSSSPSTSIPGPGSHIWSRQATASAANWLRSSPQRELTFQPLTTPWSRDLMGHNGSRKSHTSRRDVTLMAAAASDSFSPVNQLSTASLLSLTGLELFSNVLIAPGLSGSLTKLSLAHSSIAKLISEVQEGISSRASCLGCVTIVDFFKSPMYSKAAMSKAVRTICISLRLQKPKICHGISHAFEDDLDYIGRHSKLSPEEMCSILLSVDCGHRVTDKTDWTVFIPAKLPTDWGHGYAQPTGDRLAAGLSDGRDRQGDTIEFVQVTDMHVDTQYEHGSNANCDEPVCCRSSSSSSSSGSSSLSHFAADTADIAGLWGDYRKCDSPLRTVVSALDQIVKSHPEAQYWIWTGDIGPHDHFSTKEEIISHVRLVTQLVKQYAKVPVIPVIGNHETSPANSFPPPSITGPQSISWLYEVLAEEWAPWLTDSALTTLKYGGYYTMPLRPRLRAVIMNSNYCARLNPWTLYDSVDPGNQLDWLVKVLAEAEQAHERVHIVGHIAPDPTECTRPWLRNFLNILERFQDTIVGQFYGHTHRDEFRVYTSAHGMPIGMGLIGPSLTSYKGNNPAYRTYQINHSGHIRDHHTYYFNLTEANLSLIPTWRKMYTFSSAYGLPTVAHDNLNYLVHLMRMDDELFAMFYRYYSREANMAATGLTPCNDLCKANILDELIVDERQKPRKISKKYYGES